MTEATTANVDFRRSLHEVPTRDGHRLLVTRTRGRVGTEDGPAVLVVPGFCQNRFFFDLPGRSFVEYLARRGYDTWNLELRGHGLSRANGAPYAQEIREYFDLDLPAALDVIHDATGGDRILAVGHSLGGALFYALHREYHRMLRGLVTIASPYKFRSGHKARLTSSLYVLGLRYTALRWLHPRHFALDLIGRVIRQNLWYFDTQLARVPFQAWFPGSIERDLLETFLAHGFDRTGIGVIDELRAWSGSEHFIDPLLHREQEAGRRGLPFPVLYLAGDRDEMVTVDDVRLAYDEARAPRKQFRCFGPPESQDHWGHIDLIVGRRAPSETWPYIEEWSRELGR